MAKSSNLATKPDAFLIWSKTLRLYSRNSKRVWWNTSPVRSSFSRRRRSGTMYQGKVDVDMVHRQFNADFPVKF